MNPDAALERISARVEAEVKRGREDAAREFDNLRADYLRLMAEVADPNSNQSDEAIDARSERQDQLLQSIIESEAIRSFQLDFKFDLLREMLNDHSLRLELALLESIRHDALGNWSLDD